MKPLISFCIPTNGIKEWVEAVTASIYAQKEADFREFEVVIANNGDDPDFEIWMEEACQNHRNLVYKKTNAQGFLNQIEAFKLCQGEYIKFVNHRMLLRPGSVQYLIENVRSSMQDKPVFFFSNGMLGIERRYACDSFDEFIKKLGVNSSWSAGIGIWREWLIDSSDKTDYNKLFPHTGYLFSRADCENYIIDDNRLLEEITQNSIKKGSYNLFFAFAVEYPALILELYRAGRISVETYKSVLVSCKKFVAEQYLQFCLRKKPCSYNLTGFSDAMGIFYTKYEIYVSACQCVLNAVSNKLKICLKKFYRRKINAGYHRN